MKTIVSLILATFSLSLFAFSNPSLEGSWEMVSMKRSYIVGENSKAVLEKILFSDTIGNNGVANYQGQYFTELIFGDEGKVLINYVVAASQEIPLNGKNKEIVIGSVYDSVYTSLTIERSSKDELVLSRRITCSESPERCPENVKSVKEFYFYAPISAAQLEELRVSQSMRTLDKEVEDNGIVGGERFSEVQEY
jgi:hypothetical protein